jgi:hypothetical protein
MVRRVFGPASSRVDRGALARAARSRGFTIFAHAMRHFPSPSTQSVPPRLEDVRGKRYQSAAADWAASPWHELQFSIPQPQYYAYSYESEGAGATAKAVAVARGDLNGDGTVATYSVPITPDAKFHAQIGALIKEDSDE